MEQRDSRRDRDVPFASKEVDSQTPPLTPSSEASIKSKTQITARSLIAKRYREIRTYLQYIKTGHPNVCAMEAFLDFLSVLGDSDISGDVMIANYYEYCDGGDLSGLMDHYEQGYVVARDLREERLHALYQGFLIYRGAVRPDVPKTLPRQNPPELFIWHIYSQLIGAVAFLHNEHPDYMNKKEHKNRASVMTADLAPANIFLKWPAGKNRRTCYPDVKVGDFGITYFLPKGGELELGEGNLDSVWAEPPENDVYDGKTDVWCVGTMVYMLGNEGKQPSYREEGVREDGTKYMEYDQKQIRKREERQRKHPARVQRLEIMYSSHLDECVRAALDMDRRKRPDSGSLCKDIELAYTQRRHIMFRALPQEIQQMRGALKHKFPENRISDLIAGDWEKEYRARQDAAFEAEEIDDRDQALMWVEKARKLRLGIELEEYEEGNDDDNKLWLQQLIDHKPNLYDELLGEARVNVPSP